MKNLILFGGPGSGKGTQAARLIEQYQLTHISTGVILRAEMEAKTELGTQVKAFIDQGKLVPDHIVINVVKHVINEQTHTNGFLYDGFPRTESQALALQDMLKSLGMKIDKVFFLTVDDDVLSKRLLIRSISSGRIDDASEEIIQARIKEYGIKTKPLKLFYEKQNLLIPINGHQSVHAVYQDIINNL